MTFAARAICVEQAGKIPGRPWIVPLLLHDVSAQGKA